MKEMFRKFATKTSEIVGSAWSFMLALLVLIVWAITGPLFGFSDTWQLIINTGTTIVTFLIVFLIQNTQNRDAVAMQLKLDELIRASTQARNSLVDLEELSDDELRKLQEEFRRVCKSRGNIELLDDQVEEAEGASNRLERDLSAVGPRQEESSQNRHRV